MFPWDRKPTRDSDPRRSGKGHGSANRARDNIVFPTQQVPEEVVKKSSYSPFPGRADPQDSGAPRRSGSRSSISHSQSRDYGPPKRSGSRQLLAEALSKPEPSLAAQDNEYSKEHEDADHGDWRGTPPHSRGDYSGGASGYPRTGSQTSLGFTRDVDHQRDVATNSRSMFRSSSSHQLREDRAFNDPYEGPSSLRGSHAARQELLQKRKMDKLRREVNEKMHFPTQQDTKEAMDEVFSELTNSHMADAITDSLIDQIVRQIKERVRSNRDAMARRTEASDRRRFGSNELAKASTASSPPAPRNREDSLEAILHAPGVLDDYDALAWAQKQAQERAEQQIKEHEREVKLHTRSALEQQMKEHELAKAHEVERKRRELAEVQARERKFEEEARERKELLRRKQQEVRSMLTGTIEERNKIRQRSADHHKRLEQEYMATLEAKERAQAEKEAQTRRRHREHMVDVMHANEEAEERKILQKAEEIERDKKCQEEYDKKMEREERRRKEYMARLHMYDKLHENERDLPSDYKVRLSKEKEEDRKRLQKQQELEAAMDAKDREKMRRHRQEEVERLRVLDEQHRYKELRAEQDRIRRRMEQQKLEDDARRAEEEQRRQRAQRHDRLSDYRHELDDQVSTRNRQKVDRHVMPEQERRLHASFLKHYLSPAEVARDVAKSPGAKSPVGSYDRDRWASPTGLSLGTSRYDAGMDSRSRRSGLSPDPAGRKSPFGSAAQRMFS